MDNSFGSKGDEFMKNGDKAYKGIIIWLIYDKI
jgi:hypothetical protein